MATQNAAAKAFKALHQRPNKPLALANVWDIISARAVAELESTEALATASFSVARTAGLEDEQLTLNINVAAVKGIAKVAAEFNKPLSVDIQDAYGPELEKAINALIDLGVAAINLEDCELATGELYTPAEAASRIERVLEVAKERGVPDFVVNARCDALVKGHSILDAVVRGKRYLAAGATTVFVWGGKRGVTRSEVDRMVSEFDGRLAVLAVPPPAGLSVKELADIGVARYSVGPSVMFAAIQTMQDEAKKLLG
ncbi:Phosphoenolpyruvate/pyruvate domain-containing protein [Xylaria bambusicola]|uniref:Phosphoenolpyruvate/pyruvate domain-containing protein n=1 Tax=Xylaria bambusicola TaxID=326684 RepID=UPI002008961D|nr:Phosphoenolpyruvate/pyruvate domain-containing protein [Xylaria bambusicola]KAI0503156.1 Phosphoenolpyruvate/pyruvate domain-containing protein [Xylaria bambusicola]